MGPSPSHFINDHSKTYGQTNYLQYGSSSIQGARISNENVVNCEIRDDFRFMYYTNKSKTKFEETDIKFSFFGLFDGHGGTELPKFASENILDFLLEKESKRNCGEINQSNFLKDNETIKDAFFDLDEKVMEGESDNSLLGGCETVSILVIPRSKSTLELISMNLGLVTSILYHRGDIFPLTVFHCPVNNIEEKKRIEDIGGFVEHGRVNGILSITRTLGDSSYKKGIHSNKRYISSVPHISRMIITPSFFNKNNKNNNNNNNNSRIQSPYTFVLILSKSFFQKYEEIERTKRINIVCQEIVGRLKEQEENTYLQNEEKRWNEGFNKCNGNVLGFPLSIDYFEEKESKKKEKEYVLDSICGDIINMNTFEEISNCNNSCILVLLKGKKSMRKFSLFDDNNEVIRKDRMEREEFVLENKNKDFVRYKLVFGSLSNSNKKVIKFPKVLLLL